MIRVMDPVTTETRATRVLAEEPNVDLSFAEVKESPPIVPPPVPKLTLEEDTFALAVIECAGNVGAAYRMAYGTDQEFATAKGKQLLGNPLVQTRIQEILMKVQDANLISLGSHLAELADIRDTAKMTGQIKVALGAERSRGEAAGLYAKHNAARAADLSNQVVINVMSPDQLMQHANRKMGIVTDVTAKE